MTLRFWDENVALYTTSDTFAVVVNATYKNLSNLFFSQNSPAVLECKKREADTPELRATLDFLEPHIQPAWLIR